MDTQVEELPPALNRNLEARATYKCVEHSSRTLGRMGAEAYYRVRGYLG